MTAPVCRPAVRRLRKLLTIASSSPHPGQPDDENARVLGARRGRESLTMHTSASSTVTRMQCSNLTNVRLPDRTLVVDNTDIAYYTRGDSEWPNPVERVRCISALRLDFLQDLVCIRARSASLWWAFWLT